MHLATALEEARKGMDLISATVFTEGRDLPYPTMTLRAWQYLVSARLSHLHDLPKPHEPAHD